MEGLKEKPKYILSHNQYVWLDQHGGRNENDVDVDKDGYFVWMADGHGGFLRVYLPKSE